MQGEKIVSFRQFSQCEHSSLQVYEEAILILQRVNMMLFICPIHNTTIFTIMNAYITLPYAR